MAHTLDGCPVRDDAVACLTTIATNAVLCSLSGVPGRNFKSGWPQFAVCLPQVP